MSKLCRKRNIVLSTQKKNQNTKKLKHSKAHLFSLVISFCSLIFSIFFFFSSFSLLSSPPFPFPNLCGTDSSFPPSPPLLFFFHLFVPSFPPSHSSFHYIIASFLSLFLLPSVLSSAGKRLRDGSYQFRVSPSRGRASPECGWKL